MGSRFKSKWKPKYAPPKAPQADRRTDPRVPAAKDVVILPCPDGRLGASMRASLVDMSKRGVGLTCLGNLPEGTPFILRLERPAGAPLMRLYEVVRTRDLGGACLIGARFVRDLRPTS